MAIREGSSASADSKGRGTEMGAGARGGAAVGAGFGGLLGAVIGWLLGAQVTDVPTIGPVVGQWVLPSTLVGLLAGAAIGALIGALAAITTVGQSQTTSQVVTITSPLVEDASVEGLVAAPSAEVGNDDGLAEEVQAVASSTGEADTPLLSADAPPGADSATISKPLRRRAPRARRAAPDEENGGPIPASSLFPEISPDEAAKDEGRRPNMEVTNVSDEQKGRDPNTFTGTTDAIDPETGALGTAGTPVTTGYGVSGSTVGTGSRRRQKKQEKDDFRGATPDSASYDVGGRGTEDAGVLKGTERQASVVDRNTDAGRVEASIPRDVEGRDVYEQSEGYVENLERDAVSHAGTRRKRGTHKRAGTDITGTGDPRGLGDNTDK